MMLMQEENAVATWIPGNHFQKLTPIQSVPRSKHTPPLLYKPVS
jgi:hypothetical protein